MKASFFRLVNRLLARVDREELEQYIRTGTSDDGSYASEESFRDLLSRMKHDRRLWDKLPSTLREDLEQHINTPTPEQDPDFAYQALLNLRAAAHEWQVWEELSTGLDRRKLAAYNAFDVSPDVVDTMEDFLRDSTAIADPPNWADLSMCLRAHSTLSARLRQESDRLTMVMRSP